LLIARGTILFARFLRRARSAGTVGSAPKSVKCQGAQQSTPRIRGFFY
jgi:hypothetical protein